MNEFQSEQTTRLLADLQRETLKEQAAMKYRLLHMERQAKLAQLRQKVAEAFAAVDRVKQDKELPEGVRHTFGLIAHRILDKETSPDERDALLDALKRATGCH